MNRMLTIAQTEFLALVRTKAFIFGILLIPALMTVFITFMSYAESHVDTTDRAVAVIDRTGVLFEPLARAADAHNQKAGTGDAKTAPHYQLSRADSSGRSIDDVTVELSEKVKARDLFGFVEKPHPRAISPGGSRPSSMTKSRGGASPMPVWIRRWSQP
jgi:hypothetical protein